MKRALMTALLFGGLVVSSTARADEFPAGDMHDVVATACTACHVAAQVTAQHKTSEQWAETVSQMISNGAQVKDSDFDKVVAYLTQHFGPVGQ